MVKKKIGIGFWITFLALVAYLIFGHCTQAKLIRNYCYETGDYWGYLFFLSVDSIAVLHFILLLATIITAISLRKRLVQSVYKAYYVWWQSCTQYGKDPSADSFVRQIEWFLESHIVYPKRPVKRSVRWAQRAFHISYWVLFISIGCYPILSVAVFALWGNALADLLGYPLVNLLAGAFFWFWWLVNPLEKFVSRLIYECAYSTFIADFSPPKCAANRESTGKPWYAESLDSCDEISLSMVASLTDLIDVVPYKDCYDQWWKTLSD